MMSFSAMTLASTAFVAQVGSDELAGVGLGGVANFTMICFGIGLLRGGKTVISQAIGANRRDLINELYGAPREAHQGAARVNKMRLPVRLCV
jgi:Na+-driven multidrug efflux pump